MCFYNFTWLFVSKEINKATALQAAAGSDVNYGINVESTKTVAVAAVCKDSSVGIPYNDDYLYMTATGTVTVVQETVAAGDTATMTTITVSPALPSSGTTLNTSPGFDWDQFRT